jgi:hypothetical protein
VNSARFAFLDPRAEAFHLDWETIAKGMVAVLQEAANRDPHDRNLFRPRRCDRRMPEIDFDVLELPATGTLPIGVPGAGREGGARNRQQPRRSPRPPQRATR